MKLRISHNKRSLAVKRYSEEQMMFNSRYYCPSCTGGGDLFVKDTEAYLNHEEHLEYYCKKCKRTFLIDEPRDTHTIITTREEGQF